MDKQQSNFGDNLKQLHKGRSRSANGASEPLINYFNFFQLTIPTSSSDDGHSESELCGDFTTRPSKPKVPVDIVLEI